MDDVWESLTAVPGKRYALAGASTLVAYLALAWYDRIALLHLGVRHISWLFVSVTSFTTYALSHNIGASVFSGAVVRYRAYTSKGLGAPQIAVLVALCSFTFGLGTILLGGIVLTVDPGLLHRLEDFFPAALTNPATARIVGLVLLGLVALYVVGSILHLPPIVIRKAKLEYPRPAIMARQLLAAPLELLGAAGIIYFVLPSHLEPSFVVVLAVFLASFSAALVSHAPGGLGVFELVFLTAMPDIPKADVLAALIVFRLFYLLIPFALSLIVVVLFERARLAQAWRGRVPGSGPLPPSPLVYDGWQRSGGAWVLALSTLLGGKERGFFIPYRYADSVVPIDYPALQPLFEVGPATIRDGDRGYPGPVIGTAFDRPRCRASPFRPGLVPTPRCRRGLCHRPKVATPAHCGGRFRPFDPLPRSCGGRRSVADDDNLHRPCTPGRPIPARCRPSADPLHEADPAIFSSLESGDVLFVDSSHIAMPGTDVDRLFLDILPRLAAGALVHIHDVTLPYAYPVAWNWRGYNEQMLVGALLQGGGYQLVFASHFVGRHMIGEEPAILRELFIDQGAHETSVWLRKR